MRLRLFLSFFLIVIVTTLIVLAVVGQRARNDVRNFVSRGGLYGSERFVADLEQYYARQRSWQGVETLFQRPGPGNGYGYGAGPPPSIAVLADEEGRILFGSPYAGHAEILSELQRRYAVALYSDSELIGYYLPGADLTPQPDAAVSLISRLNRTVLLSALVGGGLSIVLASLLTYQLMRPVRALTQASRRLAAGDLSQRVAARGGGELSALGKAFNHMADSLQTAEARRKALTADIAHELRTPISVQRANLEALKDGIYPLTRENLDPVLEQTQLLEHLVEDLRTLALADAGELPLDKVPGDIAAAIQRIVSRFESQAAQNQVGIQVKLPAHCPPIAFDPHRLDQILHNLLSNALQHTPATGNIRVSVDCMRDQIQVRVKDSGPGIPESALPHIFDRFYRMDRSRSRTDGGTGLGLAIARKLAEVHGGELTAANDAAGGAIFTLSLPAAGI